MKSQLFRPKPAKRTTDEAKSEAKSNRRSYAMDDVGDGSRGAQGSADTWIAPTGEVMGDTEVFDRESDTVTLEPDARPDIVIDSMKLADQQQIAS